MPQLFIGYYRVSTQKQGASGLGMDSQRSMMDMFIRSNSGELVATYEEVESGKRADRPQLHKALAHAKSIGAKLVIAKLDRLARNVAFLSSLMESGADFVAIDNPHATRLTTHILAAVAEDEARRISDRTKGALASIKRTIAERGEYVSRSGRTITGLGAGSGHWSDPARSEQMKAGLAKARSVASTVQRGSVPIKMVLPAMREMRQQSMTFRQIAEKLNAEGVTTRLGGKWSAGTVLRAMRQRSAA